MQTITHAADRREYFRINDQIALKYRIIEHAEIDGAIAKRKEGLPDVNSMASSFASTNLDMKHAIEKCRRELPEVATYLDGLNSKLEVLIRLLLANGSELPDHPTHDVNLSASGLRLQGNPGNRRGLAARGQVVVLPLVPACHDFRSCGTLPHQ